MLKFSHTSGLAVFPLLSVPPFLQWSFLQISCPIQPGPALPPTPPSVESSTLTLSASFSKTRVFLYSVTIADRYSPSSYSEQALAFCKDKKHLKEVVVKWSVTVPASSSRIRAINRGFVREFEVVDRSDCNDDKKSEASKQ